TSRLDVDLLEHDHAARFVRARLALGLRQLSDCLRRLALAEQQAGIAPVHGQYAVPELPDLMEALTLLDAADSRVRLLPVVAARLRYLRDEVEAIRELLLGEATRASL